jgi:hypothetical protein
VAVYEGWRYIEGGDESKYLVTGISVNGLSWLVSEDGTVSGKGGEGALLRFDYEDIDCTLLDGMMGYWESGNEP